MNDRIDRLRKASQGVVRELGFLDPSYGDAGMPFSHWHAMMEIELGVTSQRELASRLNLDKSTTSRVVDRLLERKWVATRRSKDDARRADLELTAAGKAKAKQSHAAAAGRVEAALSLISESERDQLVESMQRYGQALRRSRLRGELEIRPLTRADNPAVANIIRTVMPEFGADGPGFAIHDAEVNDMHASYRKPRSAYFVVTDRDGTVVGGGGVAPLEHGDRDTCELRKMYFLPVVRGLGVGQAVLDRCLAEARRFGFKRCYLETLRQMTQAQALYRKNGFEPLKAPMGNTGHHGCDTWFIKKLAGSKA